VCDNSAVDRGKGYNRTARKLLHITGGLLAFAVPFVPYWFGLISALGALALSYLLRPRHAWWLRIISKPADRNRNVITGLRGYAWAVLALVLMWGVWLVLRRFGADGFWSSIEPPRYVMFGWMALAFGDGLAGLVGPGPSVASTVPWNRHKTWWGLLGCFCGVALAHVISFGVPFAALEPLPLAVQLSTMPVIAAVVALLESLDIRIDDNYVVGIGAPLLACVLHLIVS
jgi:dolichol kinase